MIKILEFNRRYFPTKIGFVRPLTTDMQMGAIGDWSAQPPETLVVLVEGDIGEYAAYAGHGPLEWVAAHGDKLSFAEARFHFPRIEAEKYKE